jgi:hypothetical protein
VRALHAAVLGDGGVQSSGEAGDAIRREQTAAHAVKVPAHRPSLLGRQGLEQCCRVRAHHAAVLGDGFEQSSGEATCMSPQAPTKHALAWNFIGRHGAGERVRMCEIEGVMSPHQLTGGRVLRVCAVCVWCVVCVCVCVAASHSPRRRVCVVCVCVVGPARSLIHPLPSAHTHGWGKVPSLIRGCRSTRLDAPMHPLVIQAIGKPSFLRIAAPLALL